MALCKNIKQDDGVVTNYHRILFIQITTNQHNSVVVMSYVDEESRTAPRTDNFRPYCRTITYETDYDPAMTIEGAYNYLKTLPEFEGATDI